MILKNPKEIIQVKIRNLIFFSNRIFVLIDIIIDEKFQSESTDASLRRKQDSDSIVRGILSNSIKYNHEKQSGLKIKTKINDFIFLLKIIFSCLR
jgi:hypothetical protein